MKNALIAALAKDYVKESAVFIYGMESDLDMVAAVGRKALDEISSIVRELSDEERHSYEQAVEVAEADFPKWIDRIKALDAPRLKAVDELQSFAKGLEEAIAMKEREGSGGLH